MLRAMQREREDATNTKNDADDEAKAMAKWRRTARSTALGRRRLCAHEIQAMIETSIWCTKTKTEMSLSVVVTRGGEWNGEGSKRRRELTGTATESGGCSSSIAAAWRRRRCAWRGRKRRRRKGINRRGWGAARAREKEAARRRVRVEHGVLA